MFSKEHFARCLRVERAKRKWTQGDLAKAVGVSTDTVKNWENENSPIAPSFPTACKVADICGISIEAFASHEPHGAAVA